MARPFIVAARSNADATGVVLPERKIFLPSALTFGIMYTRIGVSFTPRRLPCKSEISCARKPPASRRFA